MTPHVSAVASIRTVRPRRRILDIRISFAAAYIREKSSKRLAMTGGLEPFPCI